MHGATACHSELPVVLPAASCQYQAAESGATLRHRRHTRPSPPQAHATTEAGAKEKLLGHAPGH